MNHRIFIIVMFSCVVSLIGTMIGALIGISVKHSSKKVIGFIMGITAGLMLCISVGELIPEAIHNGGVYNTAKFFLLGVLVIFIINNITSKKSSNNDKHIITAFLVALGLMLHNIPEGFIMGFGFLTGSSLGFKMSIIIAIHDIPEGMAVAAPLMASKMRRMKILLYVFLTAIPTAIGALAGMIIGNISSYVLGASLSVAAGIMVYVASFKAIDEAKDLGGRVIAYLGAVFGAVIGIIMIKGL